MGTLAFSYFRFCFKKLLEVLSSKDSLALIGTYAPTSKSENKDSKERIEVDDGQAEKHCRGVATREPPHPRDNP